MNKKDEKFVYFDSEEKEHSIIITDGDFKQVNADKKIHDVKFETKPTTFMKDAMRRFVKNKSSVVGGVILGFIVLFAFVLPIVLPSDISVAHLDQRFLAPKLFSTGTGWWDGTITYNEDVVYDTKEETPAGYVQSAVTKLSTWESTTNNSNKYAYGGYLRFAVDTVTNPDQTLDSNIKYLESYPFTLNLDNTYKLSFELSNENTNDAFEFGKFNTYVKYKVNATDTDYTYVYLFDNYVNTYKTYDFDISAVLKAKGVTGHIASAVYGFNIYPSYTAKQQILIKSVTTTSSNADEEANVFSLVSFSDANAQVAMVKTDDETKVDNIGYWGCNGFKYLFKASITYCHFTYDTYEAIYGNRDMTLASDIIKQYVKAGYITYDFKVGTSSFKILDADKCPINEVYSQTTNSGVITTYSLDCSVSYYKYLGFSKIPTYLFGTDSLGKDLLKLMFSGLRTSLLLGLITSAINIIIGVIWGSISGYFGGWTDLLMERFTDILGRIPWIVIMTLCILYLGQNFGTFALALCLTGWMGAAGTTRAQFYRFKGREYVLASRTLGATDTRLIFRHILPNSLGTLVTSSVFMIPGVIYTEATLSYLNLGLQGMDSFGIILSENQQYISSNSYLIFIPSLVMAFMMISFNLFGNGLRDAFNPSLKGSE
jgi:ABC-type dipeptide/oligopeptide/nickel transport systems, permease components